MNELHVRPCSGMQPKDILQATEIIERRRPNGKTFSLGNRIYRSSTKFGEIHYKHDYADGNEQWKEIDLTIDANGQVNTAPYQLTIYQDRVGYSYISRRGGRVEVELVEVGHTPVDNKRFSVRIQDSQLFYDDVAPDLDMQVLLRPLSCEIFKRLKTNQSARHFRWLVREWLVRELFLKQTSGKDSSGDGRLEMNVSVVPTGITPIDYNEYYYDEEWTGRVSKIVSNTTRQREWQDELQVIYPVIIDAATQENIAANNDDGYESTNGPAWGASYNGTAWLLGYYALNSGYYHGGVRFQTLGVPQGATINTATITLLGVRRLNNRVGGIPTIIYGDDVDDAGAWSNGDLPSGVTKTAANVNFTPNPGTGTGAISSPFTPAVTAIVQEIINRGGWASGNDIRFAILAQTNSTQNSIYMYDYAQGQPNAAILDVDYTISGRVPRHGFTNFQVPGIV